MYNLDEYNQRNNYEIRVWGGGDQCYVFGWR